MVKVIETNISLDGYYKQIDHQSRVIEVESWEAYVKEIQECKSVWRKAAIGSMDGITLPREMKLEDFQYDEKHLTATFYDKTRKLAYLIGE